MGWQKILMYSMFIVPLSQESPWTQLKFNKINPHKIEFNNSKMQVSVNSSAMPLIYKLDKPMIVKALRVKGKVSHMLELSSAKSQGDFENDDFIFKIGIVKSGNKKLNWIQKKLAAQWVVQLYEAAPDGQGISEVEFFSIVQQKPLLGKRRNHPLGKGLISENYQWFMDSPGEFDFMVKLEKPTKVLALWLAPDGDDTKSKFNLSISHIQLN